MARWLVNKICTGKCLGCMSFDFPELHSKGRPNFHSNRFTKVIYKSWIGRLAL